MVAYDDEHIATIVLNGLQDTYPWYVGRIVDGPAMSRWQDLVEVFAQADLEFDYCPHHPDEGPYDDTDLADYVAELAVYRQRRLSGERPDGDDRAQHWGRLDDERLAVLAEFVDFRRWKAVTVHGEIVEGVPLPPNLDLSTRRFAYRP